MSYDVREGAFGPLEIAQAADQQHHAGGEVDPQKGTGRVLLAQQRPAEGRSGVFCWHLFSNFEITVSVEKPGSTGKVPTDRTVVVPSPWTGTASAPIEWNRKAVAVWAAAGTVAIKVPLWMASTVLLVPSE